MPPTTMTIPSATRHLSKVRRFVTERAAAAGLPEADVNAIRLAVDEACANAIEHAYGGRDDGTVVVETAAGKKNFVVCVRHTGVPFNPDRYEPVVLGEGIRERRRGGFGVALMNRLVDEVQYRQSADGAEVRLVKKITDRSNRNG